MKYLILFILSLILLSCMTPKSWERKVKKAIAKGWIDTSRKTVDSTFKPLKEDSIFDNKTNKAFIDSLFEGNGRDTVYKDTCYSKNGKIEKGILAFSPYREKDRIEKLLTKQYIPKIKSHCLSTPLILDNKDIFIKTSQDTLTGLYNVEYKLKRPTITVVNGTRTWWQRFVADVWFLWVVIGFFLIKELIPLIIKAIKS